MSRNDDYTTGNLLDCLYHQKYYQVIDTDKARHSLIYWQTNTAVPQQFNFTEKLEKDGGVKMFFYC